MNQPMELRALALQALAIDDPSEKVEAVHGLRALAPSHLSLDGSATLTPSTALPGRPPRPHLVPAKQVPSRTPFTPEGRAALLHAIAHIEFNAINLALDAIWRFAGMPDDFYWDWLRVADEEASHFTLLNDHLHTLDHRYGDFDAHNGLWAMCEATASEVIARMALVPRTLEARGLDATPAIQDKLARAGDAAAVAILDVIAREEIGHVAIGNRWYRWLCERAGLEPIAHYAALIDRYQAPRLRPPFNLAARRAAGFTAQELAALDRLT